MVVVGFNIVNKSIGTEEAKVKFSSMKLSPMIKPLFLSFLEVASFRIEREPETGFASV